jgi:hypothetical protein
MQYPNAAAARDVQLLPLHPPQVGVPAAAAAGTLPTAIRPAAAVDTVAESWPGSAMSVFVVCLVPLLLLLLLHIRPV